MKMLPAQAIESIKTDCVKLGVSPDMPVIQRMTEYSLGVRGLETSSSISSFLSGRMYEERLNLMSSWERATPTKAKIHIICILKDFILLSSLSHLLSTTTLPKMHGSNDITTKEVDGGRKMERPLTRKEIARQMTLLRYNLNSLSDQIGKSRDEDVSFASQKEYEAKQREYNFLKDLKRRCQFIPRENHSFIVGSESLKIFQPFFSLNHRDQQSLSRELKSKNQLLRIGPQLSQNIKQKIKEKFIQHCKNQSTLPSYFSEVVPEGKVMKYKSFFHFTKQTGLEEVLSFQERMRIFNKHSKFKKRLLFEQFYAAMEDCCKIICDNHQTRFSQHNFRVFLSNILAKLQISFIAPKNHSIKRLQVHSGLFKQSMEDILADGRRFLDEKKAKSIESRKKLLARIKQPFPLVNRSVSLKKQQAAIALPQPVHEFSFSLKKMEPQCVSYTSLIKSRQQYQKNRSQKGSMRVNERSNRSRQVNSKTQYQKQISGLVDLDEPDAILQQILTKNYKK